MKTNEREPYFRSLSTADLRALLKAAKREKSALMADNTIPTGSKFLMVFDQTETIHILKRLLG